MSTNMNGNTNGNFTAQPQGQSPPKKGMSSAMTALVVIGCLFGGCAALATIGAVVSKDKPAHAATAPAPEPSPKAIAASAPAPKAKAQAAPVTAAQLFTDYKGNEVAADDKYKGKALLVTGTVSEVRKDFTESIIIGLRSSNQFMPVDAHVADSEKGKAAQTTKGASVVLRCEGKGMIVGRPQLGACTFE